MRLAGAATRFRIAGAGAFWTEVEFTEEGEELDLGVTEDDRWKGMVDPSTRRGRITSRGFVDDTSNANFIDVCKVGVVVAVTDLTKVEQNRLDFYAPWQVRSCGLKHGKRTASEDNMELIGTGGAIDADFNPNAYGPSSSSSAPSSSGP